MITDSWGTVTTSSRFPYFKAISAVMTFVVLAGFLRSKTSCAKTAFPPSNGNTPADSAVSVSSTLVSSVTTARSAANPSAVLPLPEITLPVGSAFCHVVSPPLQRHTIPQKQKIARAPAQSYQTIHTFPLGALFVNTIAFPSPVAAFSLFVYAAQFLRYPRHRCPQRR